MSSFSGVLPLPASGERIAAKKRVDYRNTEEAALVRRAQAGDQMAFRDIVERYQSKVFSIIYGILRNHNDAEDIAQQVFTKVYFSIGNFDFRSSLLTWIYKITVNECYDYLRKKKVRKLVYESDFTEEDTLRMENSEPARDQRQAIDITLAQRDLALKLLARLTAGEGGADPDSPGESGGTVRLHHAPDNQRGYLAVCDGRRRGPDGAAGECRFGQTKAGPARQQAA